MLILHLFVLLLGTPTDGGNTPTANASRQHRLVVRIVGIDSNAGSMAIALYDSADRYDARDAPLRATFLPIENRSCEWVVDGLETGIYAVMVFHDRNGNGILDRRRVFGIPKEPYGFSNNASAATGPPDFDKAAFEVGDGERIVEIRLR